MTSDVEIDLLGPVQGRVRGKAVALGPPQQRALLAALAIDLGRSVPVVDLIDRLWGGRPPKSAHKSIQKYVSQLRSVLGRDTIDHVADGYRLVLAPEAVDVRRFEARLAAARTATAPEERYRLLAQALTDHAGTALLGLDADFAVTERSRVEELRLAAEEARLDAALDLGRLPQVVQVAAELTEAHPFREELWSRLMIALYRSGRQAEAVRAYQRCRTVLATELGLEPGPALRRLEARILAHDPDLLQPPEPPEPSGPPAPLLPRRPSTSGAATPTDPEGGGDDDHGAGSGGGRRVEARRRAERRQLLAVAAANPPATAAGLEALRATAVAHGGRLGVAADGPVVVFGLPAHDDDAIRAAQVALALHRGGGSGPVAVVAGAAVVIDGPHGLLVDDELVRRARTTAHAGGPDPAGPILDATARERLAPVARIELDGQGQALIDLRATPASTPEAPGALAADVAFVGRSFELGRLVDLWQSGRAAASPQLVLVTGEGGIGKTRLVGELRARVGAESTSWLTVSCRDQADGPFAAITRLFDAAFGPEPLIAVEQRAAGWGLADGEAAWLLHHLSLLYLTSSTAAVDHDESLRAWAQLLNQAVGDAGVIAIDDLHLAPATLRQLVDELLTTATGALLVVGAQRPEGDAASWTSTAGHPTTVVPLGPLDPMASGRLARTLLGSSADAAAEIARRSGGNPYFLHELARTLAETGRVDDAPATVRQTLAARIDRSGDLARLVLQTAAVVDAAVDADTLAELTHLPVEAVGSALAVLRRRRLMAGVEHAPSAHRVAHPLVAEVAAAQVTAARSLAVHRAMTARLIDVLELLRQPSQQERGRGDTEPGAAGTTPSDTADDSTVAALLGLPLDRLEQADAHAVRAEALADSLHHPDLPLLRRTAGVIALALGLRLEHLDALRSGEALTRAVDRLEPGTEIWARASTAAGVVAAAGAEWAASERLLDQAIEVFARTGNRRAEAEARIRLDTQRRMRGDERAGEQVAVALDLVGDDPGPELAIAVSWRAAHLAIAGLAPEALAVAAEHRPMVEAHGTDEARIRLLNSVALAQVDSGDPAGLDELVRVHRLSIDLGLTRQAISAANNLANNLWFYRGPGPALPVIEEARAFAVQRRQEYNFDYLGSTEAEILFDVGSWNRAEAMAQPLLARPEWSQMTASAAWIIGKIRMWRDQDGWVDLLSDQYLDPIRRIGDLQHISPWLALVALASARQGDRDRVVDLVHELREATADNPRWRCAELDHAMRALILVGAADEGRDLVPVEPLTLPRAELTRRTAAVLLARADGRVDEALPELRSLLEAWSDFGVPLAEGLVADELAIALETRGDAVNAERARVRSATILARLGIPLAADGRPLAANGAG